jgi:type IV secretory pathway VirJ component
MIRRGLLLGAAATLLAGSGPGDEKTKSPRDVSRWLIEMPVERPRRDAFVIILSGDGGWRDLDRSMGRYLRDQGVPVLGFDCLNWFWKQRNPEEVADELDRVVALYAARWSCPKVALVGYSFGADVLPFAWNRLEPATRERVALVALLAFARTAAFEIRIGDFLGLGRPTELPTAPEIPGLPPALVQCTYGSEEDAETACTAFPSPPAQLIRTTGGHHFDGDYDALARRVLERLPMRSGA